MTLLLVTSFANVQEESITLKFEKKKTRGEKMRARRVFSTYAWPRAHTKTCQGPGTLGTLAGRRTASRKRTLESKIIVKEVARGLVSRATYQTGEHRLQTTSRQTFQKHASPVPQLGSNVTLPERAR